MDRINRIRQQFDATGVDGILLFYPPNRLWTTGFASSDGAVIIGREGARFFTDSRYIEAANNSVRGMEVLITDAAHPYKTRISEAVKEFGIITLGFEEESISHKRFLEWEKSLGAGLVGAEKIIKELRSVKDEEEIQMLKNAQRIAEKAFDEVLHVVRPGVTEREIAAELVYKMLLYGAEKTSFDPIVAAGAKGSMPHAVPGDNAVKNGDFVTMDFGCVKDGYCSDTTRTVAVGAVTGRMREVYDTVLAAQKAGIAAAAAGVTGSAVDKAAREVIEKAGYGQYFGHGFGHSLGIEVHESPSASPSDYTPLRAGTVISAEPGIYIPGMFGVRIEDVIVIRDGGCENITKAPKELIVL